MYFLRVIHSDQKILICSQFWRTRGNQKDIQHGRSVVLHLTFIGDILQLEYLSCMIMFFYLPRIRLNSVPYTVHMCICTAYTNEKFCLSYMMKTAVTINISFCFRTNGRALEFYLIYAVPTAYNSGCI